jgi:tRNA C32,U32 (ribose-2'-O)-methylase TrmJ
MYHKIQPNYNRINSNIALKSDFLNFMDFLKDELNDVGFFYPQKKTKSMFENIQTMFMRSSLSKTEIQTLWGMIKKLRKQA